MLCCVFVQSHHYRRLELEAAARDLQRAGEDAEQRRQLAREARQTLLSEKARSVGGMGVTLFIRCVSFLRTERRSKNIFFLDHSEFHHINVAYMLCLRIKQQGCGVAATCKSLQVALMCQVNKSIQRLERATAEAQSRRADEDAPPRPLPSAPPSASSGAAATAPPLLIDHILKLREGTGAGAEGILDARERIRAQFAQFSAISKEGAAKYLTAAAGKTRDRTEAFGNDVAELDNNRRQMKAMQTKMKLQNFAERVEALMPEGGARKNNRSPVPGDKEGGGDGFDEESEFDGVPGSGNGRPPMLIPAAMRRLRRRARNGNPLAGKRLSGEDELKKLYGDFPPERIEKLNSDILEQSRERGRLTRLQALKRNLETHVLYQNALLLVARNELLQPSRYQVLKELPTGEPLGPNIQGASLTDLDVRASHSSFAAEDSTAHLKVSISECNEPTSLLAKVLGGLPSPPPVPLSEVVREMQRRASGLAVNNDSPKGYSKGSESPSAGGKLAGAPFPRSARGRLAPQRLSEYLTLGAHYAVLVGTVLLC